MGYEYPGENGIPDRRCLIWLSILVGDCEDGPAPITCPPDRVAINLAPTPLPSSPARMESLLYLYTLKSDVRMA